MIKNDLRILPRPGQINVRRKGVDAASLFHRMEKVIGKVLHSDRSGAAQVAIKGQTLNVHSQVPLKEGTRINLQVTGLSPRPVLRLLGEAAPGHLSPRLPELDLKMLLTEFMHAGSGKNTILQKLKLVVENIQFVNQEAFEEGGKMYIPLPMQLPGGLFSVAELLLQLPPWEAEQPEGGKAGNTALRAALLLDMSRLGPVRAEFTLMGKALEGMFLVASQATREFLEASLPLLTEALIEKGFSVQQVGCFVREPEIVMQSLLPEVVLKEDNSICLVG
jgi:hypothetical protein